jgi:drug/metabolite transporter (DMT)-like permease
MVFGGTALLVVAAATGELATFDPIRVSSQSWIAFSYLIVFGSWVGYSAYIWLVRNVAPARTATYAFVNPLVAVALGWAVAGESITARTAVAAAMIIAAVGLITLGSGDG